MNGTIPTIDPIVHNQKAGTRWCPAGVGLATGQMRADQLTPGKMPVPPSARKASAPSAPPISGPTTGTQA